MDPVLPRKAVRESKDTAHSVRVGKLTPPGAPGHNPKRPAGSNGV